MAKKDPLAEARALLPEGWQIVPCQPTKRMLRAAADAMRQRPVQEWVRSVEKHAIRWQAMLAVAPTEVPDASLFHRRPDDRLNALADERSSGPFVKVDINDL